MVKETDNEKKKRLSYYLGEIRLIEHKIKVLNQQEMTLRKELNQYYMDVGVVERELGIYVPEKFDEKEMEEIKSAVLESDKEGDGEDGL